MGGNNGEVDAIAVELQLAMVLHEQYGAPKVVYLIYEPSTQGLHVRLQWLNKTTTRLPESIWMEYRPSMSVGQWRSITATKLGSAVDLSSVVANGTWLHGTDLESGIMFS